MRPNLEGFTRMRIGYLLGPPVYEMYIKSRYRQSIEMRIQGPMYWSILDLLLTCSILRREISKIDLGSIALRDFPHGRVLVMSCFDFLFVM